VDLGERVVVGQPAQPLLHQLAGGDVDDLDDQMQRPAVPVAGQGRGQRHPDRVAVGVEQSLVDLVLVDLARDQLAGVLAIGTGVLGMHEINQAAGQQI